MADVRIENGEIKVTLVEPAAAGGKEGNEGEGKGGQVAQKRWMRLPRSQRSPLL